jgi:5-methyltetrahydrofolate--homocysteine methyltransferase
MENLAMVNIDRIKEATMSGDQNKVAELIDETISQGVDAGLIIQDGFIPAMSIVGDKFGAGEIFIPEMLMAARAMKTGMEILKPLLVGTNDHAIARAVIGTVRGDMHDIGKNLVATMMEGSGFEVIDLGIDVPADKFVEAVGQYQPQFLALSALLTTTIEQMKQVIEALEKAGLRENVTVFVGGAPLNENLAVEIGADGYGANAGQAVDSMKAVLR